MPKEHQHIDGEVANKMAMKFILDQSIDLEADGDISENEYRETLDSPLIICCKNCRQIIVSTIEKTRERITLTDEFILPESSEETMVFFHNDASQYSRGREMLKKMNIKSKEELKEHLEKITKKRNELAKSTSLKGEEKLCAALNFTEGDQPSTMNHEEECMTFNGLWDMIIAIRAALGEITVIGDEEFLAQYAHLREK